MKLSARIQTTLAQWPSTVTEAKDIQQAVRKSVSLRDDFPQPLKTVVGTDVGFKEKGALTRAAVVVLDADSFEVLEETVLEIPTCFPYVPGYLSFRELPALLQAIAQLRVEPDLFMCDGQGIAHPRRLGLASHLGVLLDKPTIGVAKSRLCGTFQEPPLEKGAASPLMDKQEQLGWVLRSRTGVKPLFISPGHKISLSSALECVTAAFSPYRLPEPTRKADKLASLKDQ
jgi:deoxyribonuclease V